MQYAKNMNMHILKYFTKALHQQKIIFKNMYAYLYL